MAWPVEQELPALGMVRQDGVKLGLLRPSVGSMYSEDQKLLVMEAYRPTEIRLESQSQFAVASDQRSLVLAAISVALAGVIAGVLNDADESFWSLGAIIFFSFSTLLAVLSALPQKMKVRGSRYVRLNGLINAGSSYVAVIAGLAEENDEAITFNEKLAKTRSHLYIASLGFFTVGTILALASINAVVSTTPV